MDDFSRVISAAHDGAAGINGPGITAAQAKSGNYRKGRVLLHGLRIAIETPQGQRRTGKSDGQPWSVICMAHYGEITGTKGADGDPLDVFIGPWPESERAWVVNRTGKGGEFDEHKILLGFTDRESAVAAYQNSYETGASGLESVVACTLDQLKWWIAYGNHAIPLTQNQLPYDGDALMNDMTWDSTGNPVGTSLPGLMYAMRRADSGEGLLLDAVTCGDVLEASDGEAVLDALVIPLNHLERKLGQMQVIMRAAGGDVKPVAMQITPPFKQRGTTNVAAIFELSDGQTVTIYFHNPDSTPNKLTPDDEMVSWKWMLNKKDVTIVVAPERGRDLNPREVARRIMRLAEANSARFAAANTKRAERMAGIEQTKASIEAKQGQLDTLNAEIARLEPLVEAKRVSMNSRVRDQVEVNLIHGGSVFVSKAQLDDKAVQRLGVFMHDGEPRIIGGQAETIARSQLDIPPPAVLQVGDGPGDGDPNSIAPVPGPETTISSAKLVWSEGSSDQDLTFPGLAELQGWFMATFTSDNLKTDGTYAKTKLNLTFAGGRTGSADVRVDVSDNSGDFNPHRQHISSHLREIGYDHTEVTAVVPYSKAQPAVPPVNHLKDAYEAGKAAFADGKPSTPPTALVERYADNKQGVDLKDVLESYAKGWHDANAAAPVTPPAGKYRYALVNRPAGLGAIPKGIQFTVEPRPEVGQDHHDMARNGILVTDRKLTDAETKSFELAPLLDADQTIDLAELVAKKMERYAAAYVEQWQDNDPQFAETVMGMVPKVVDGFRPSFKGSYLVANVGLILKQGLPKVEIDWMKATLLDSNDEIRALGNARINDVGSENVYVEKDGKPFYFKPGNTDGYEVGDHDFSHDMTFASDSVADFHPYLQSVIDGTIDLTAPAVADKLTELYEAHDGNSEFDELFAKAADAYQAFMVAAAKKAMG